MRYITTATVTVFSTPFGIGKRDTIGKGKIVNVISSRFKYSFIDSPVRGWVMSGLLQPYEATVPLPLDANIWRTVRGDKKPRWYKPEGINYGSFDIGWLLDADKLVKPQSVRLEKKHINYILWLNSGNQMKVNWLIDQTGTKDVLAYDEATKKYWIPVPCFSGNNLVKVLEWKGNFARIETVPVGGTLPDTLPPHLLHTWWAFTLVGKYYQPLGGVVYPLFTTGSSAWVQKGGLTK
jgi:hypothetical protein